MPSLSTVGAVDFAPRYLSSNSSYDAAALDADVLADAAEVDALTAEVLAAAALVLAAAAEVDADA